MLNSNLLIFSLLIGCAATENKRLPVTTARGDDAEALRLRCEEQLHAQSCARYGYLKKDIVYTRRACMLHDEEACFNLREIEQRAPNQNLALISSHQGEIYGCYVNHTIDVDDGEGIPEEKEVKLIFVINPEGNIADLSVVGKKLSQKFTDCVGKVFAARKFAATDYAQSLSYSFSMVAIKRDRRLPRKSKPGILD